ncbi:MAG: helix-turn-helix domain-containing protein [Lachnospiraceae bacterium]|nr:helix-turn-helix domain-containing protein [Lachnospiraceae bacterium]
MELSSAYLYEALSEKYSIPLHEGLSGRDRYLRPFWCPDGGTGEAFADGHVCVIPVDTEETFRRRLWEGEAEGRFRIFCGTCFMTSETVDVDTAAAPEDFRRNEAKTRAEATDAAGETAEDVYLCLALRPDEEGYQVLNEIQCVFDRCDAWNLEIHRLVTEGAGMTPILETTAAFLKNPLLVMGLDFTRTAEAGGEKLPGRARLFSEDGVNMEYMNALLQDASYQKMAESREVVLFPGYISGCRTLNRNLYVEGKPTHRLVLTECERPLTEGCVCILEELTGRLEYLLSQEAAAPAADDLEQIFQRILSDRTADYMQISRQLSAAGWSAGHEYLCLILQITYLNQKQLSTRAICQYIRKQMEDSVSFLYREEIVTFFDLTRLELDEEAVASQLVYFIRDSYLKAGYSRTMQGHMNLRRQYVQASTALDVGSRKSPYLWIHHFSQVALTYIMEQTTRRLPGNMLCHEGLLRLKQADEKNHTEYMTTLKAYLDQHLSATQAAKQLFVHRSTFLYRLDKIKEILGSDLENPDELFYLELSIRLLEQEEEKKG